MVLLFVANIAAYLFLSVFPVYYQTRYFRLGLLNPISIPFIVSLPILLLRTFGGPLYLLSDGLFDPHYQYAIFMTSLSALSSILFMLCLFRIFRGIKWMSVEKINIVPKFYIRRHRMLTLSVVFLFAFFALFFLLTKEFGLLNWVLNPRYGYQFYRTGVGHVYALCISSLSISFTLALIYFRRKIFLYLIFTFYMILAFMLGSKTLLLSFLVYFVIVLSFKKKLSILSFLVFVGMSFAALYANFILSSNPSAILDMIMYFDYYSNSALYFKEYFSGKIDLFYGQIFVSNLWNYIPRAFFPDKPYVYGITLVNEYFWPGAAAATHTPAFGGPVAAYADFGVWGVLLFPFFSISSAVSLMLNYLLYKDLRFDTVIASSNRLLLYIWCLAPSFMQFIPFPISIISFLVLYWFIGIFNRLTY